MKDPPPPDKKIFITDTPTLLINTPTVAPSRAQPYYITTHRENLSSKEKLLLEQASKTGLPQLADPVPLDGGQILRRERANLAKRELE